MLRRAVCPLVYPRASDFSDHAIILDELMEWIEGGKSYREWLVPAAVLNRRQRRRIERA